jgi:tetratricopeptide (TPR) repeat protein
MRTVRILTLATLLTVVVSFPASAWKWMEGREAFDKGDYSFAILVWTDSSVADAKENRDDPRHYMWLASAYLRTGANNKAIETANRGLSLGPADQGVVGTLQWLLGNAYLNSGQPQQALVAAQATIAAEPQDHLSYKLLADVQFALERYDDAIIAVTRAIELKPFADGYYTLGACHLQKEDLDKALESFRKGLELAPHDPSLKMAVGNVLLRQQRVDDAAAAFAEVFEKTKGEEAQRRLAWCRYAQGRYDDALSLAAEMIANAEQGRLGISLAMESYGPHVRHVVPGSPADRAGIRRDDRIEKIGGDRIHKVKDLDQIFTMLAGPPGSQVTLSIFHPDGFRREKVTLVREFLGASEAAQGYALQSLCYRGKGEADRAAATAEKAAALDARGTWVASARGFTLLDQGRADDALVTFQTNADRFEVPFRQVGRALSYARKGDLEEAAEIYVVEAAALDPRNVPLWRERTALMTALAPLRQGHVDKAKSLEAQGRYAECLVEYSKALLVASDVEEAAELRSVLFAAAARLPTPPELPEDARRRVVRGEVLIKEGDLEGAMPEFAEAIRLAPWMPKLYYNSALLNGQLKRYGEAIRLMNIYLQAAPGAPDAIAAKNEIFKWELQLERQGKN